MVTSTDVLIGDANGIRCLGIQQLIKSLSCDATIRSVVDKEKLLMSLYNNKCTHVVLSTNLTNTSLRSLITKIKRTQTDVKVLLISESNERILPEPLRASRADGIISTSAKLESFKDHLNLFLNNGNLTTEWTENYDNNWSHNIGYRNTNVLNTLSSNQSFVLKKLVEGMRICDIADKMRISKSAVSTHKVRAFHKLGVRKLPEFISLLTIQRKLA